MRWSRRASRWSTPIRGVTDAERDLIERIVQLAELNSETEGAVHGRLFAPPPLEAIVPRIPHPVPREVALLMAWQIAIADGGPAMPEHAAYGVLADRLGISPQRASELREWMRHL